MSARVPTFALKTFAEPFGQFLPSLCQRLETEDSEARSQEEVAGESKLCSAHARESYIPLR